MKAPCIRICRTQPKLCLRGDLKIKLEPWMVGLGGLSAILRTEGSFVQFPVRARAWVTGQVPSWGRERGN